MGLKLVTAPIIYPVTLAEMKKHLRVDFDDDDELIANVTIPAATQHIDGKDGWLQRALIDQTWDLYLDTFPCGSAIRIPLPPLIEVVGLFYTDEDGAEQEIDSANYVVDDTGANAWLVANADFSWPSIMATVNAVRLRFRAGYVDTSLSPQGGVVPGPIRAAILLYGGTLYAHRETIVIGQTAVQLPWAAEQLLQPYRVYI